MLISRDQLEATVCRDSFWDFVQRFWSTVVPEAAVWNWHIRVLCEELQGAAERVFLGEPKRHDIVVNIPPGTTKSLVCSVMFPAWLWTRMPSARSICASYSHHLALDLSRRSRDVVQSDKWVRLFGSVELREDQNTKGYFLNKHGGFRYAVGTSGSVTGFHAHVIIVDDPVDPNRAVSEAELKTANRWVCETLETRKVDKAVAFTILIMQRLHQDDPAANLLAKSTQDNPVRHINLPGEVVGTGLQEVRPRRLARHYVDGLLDPVRLPRAVLRSLRERLGEFGYSGQVLQRPTPLGGGMFRVDRVRVERTTPNPTNLVRRVRYWDKAGTSGAGAYTAGVLMALDRSGGFWVLHVVRGQWESGERERVIRQTAVADGPHVEVGIEQEPGSGGKESAQGTARNLAGFRVHIDRPVGDKVLRADPFSVQVNVENVSAVAGPWCRDYLEELRYFPHSTYKDQVDASSGAFAVLTRPRTRIGGLGGKAKVTR